MTWKERFSQNKKRYGKDLLAVVVIVLISLLTECVILQWNSFRNERYDRTYSLNEADEITNKWGTTTYRFELDGDYVSSVYLNYSSETDIQTEGNMVLYNGYGKEEEREFTDTAAFALGKSAIAVNGNVKEFSVEISYADAQKCYAIQFVNHTVFRMPRFLLILFVLLGAYVCISRSAYFGKKPEWMYAFISLALGTVIILSSHHSFDSWDEQIHFHTAYTDSWLGNTVEYTNPAMANAEMRVPTGDTYEEEQWIGQWLNSLDDEVVLVSEKGRFIKYNERAYLPQIAGLFLGRKLGLSYVTTVFLGKFFNLLFCTAVVSCAIRFARYGKRTLMCIGLLPTTLFLFASFTYDAFVIALLMLGIALFLTEYLGTEKINPVRTMAAITAIAVGCFPKAVYIPFLALFWLMPKEKFYSKRQKYFFKIGILVLLLIVLSSFVLPFLSNVSSGAEVGDYRGGDTSQTSQLSMILGAPLVYTGILLKSLASTFASYFVGAGALANFAYRGTYTGIGYFIVLFTMLFTFFTDFAMTKTAADAETGKKINRMKLWDAVLLIGTASLVWTALYLDFTPVGSMVIRGVSPRYYLPMLFPFSFLFLNRKITCGMREEDCRRLTALLMLFGTGAAVYCLLAAQ